MGMEHISMNAAEKAAASVTERLLGRDDVNMMSMDWQVKYCTNFTIGVLEDMGVVVGEIMRSRIKEAVISKIADWDDGFFWEEDEEYESNQDEEILADDNALRRLQELIAKAE